MATPARSGTTTWSPSIVVMNRPLHTNEVVARVKGEVEKINVDGTLPPGVSIVPYYDRSSLGQRSPPTR